MLSKNVINEVIREWSWRVPTGIPDVKSSEHLNILRDVLITDFGESMYTVNQVIHSLSGEKTDKQEIAMKMLLEAKVTNYKDLLNDKEKKDSDITGFMDNNGWLYKEGPAGWKKRLDFAKLLKAASKLQKFEDFITNLPKGIPEKTAKTALSKFTKKGDRAAFVALLAEYTEPSESMKYTSGIAKTLFELKPAGAGKGEIYLAAAVAGSKIQGGNKSYDLETSSKKYEVKDYSTSAGGPIRAGVEAAVSKFPFWNQILETVKVIQKIDAVSTVLSPWELIPDQATKTKMIILKDKILKRVNGFTEMRFDKKTGKEKMVDVSPKIVSGEFSGGDQKDFNEFYDAANSLIGVADKGYNEVRFYGPNMSVARFSIQTTSASSLSNGKKVTIELLPETDENRFELLKNYLSKLEYVRSPGGFDAGIQSAMNTIFTKNAANADSWIIFRKSGMRILASDAKNFVYKAISQNGVKFVEK
jgi:hypothetical protein